MCLLLLGVWLVFTAKAQVNTSQAIEMGRAAMFYDDYITGIQYFDRAIEAKPYLAEAYYCRALAEFNLAEYPAAEDDLHKAITFNPFHVEYYQLRGICRIYNEHYQGAVEDYSQVVKEMPDNQDAYYNRALCLFELHDYRAAGEELNYIIGRWPRFARAYVVKAQTCLEINDTLQGIFWIDSLLSISKREPNAWSVKGRYALQHGDYHLADSCYTQAVRYDAGKAEYYLCRAQARYALGDYLHAVNDYDRVLAMEPEHLVALHNRPLALGMAEHPQHYRQQPELLAVDDNEGSNRSFLEEFRGKVVGRKSERVFLPPYHADGQLLVVEGGRHPLYCNDARFLEVVRSTSAENAKPQEAVQVLEHYMQTGHRDAVLFYNIGCHHAAGGTLEDAEKAFSAAIEADALMAEAYYNKAVVYLLQNKQNLASPLLVKAGEMGISKALTLLNQLNKK